MVNTNPAGNTGNTTESVPEWGTIQQAAERTGLSGMTIRRYGAQGIIPLRRKGVRLIQVDLNKLDNIYAPLDALEASK